MYIPKNKHPLFSQIQCLDKSIDYLRKQINSGYTEHQSGLTKILRERREKCSQLKDDINKIEKKEESTISLVRSTISDKGKARTLIKGTKGAALEMRRQFNAICNKKSQKE